jgi:predicted porin
MESNVSNLKSIIATAMQPNKSTRRGISYLTGCSLVAGAILAACGAVQAQTTSATAPPAPADESLSWHGITLYGIVDVDMQYETHGAPFNNFWFAGGSEIVQKNSRENIFGVTNNGLSQSRIGLQGKESLHFLDLSGVFKVETYFNPATGQLSDALKSVVQNNGRTAGNQSTNIDSSIAGQPFEQAFVGVSSPTWGTITYGRQNSTLADLIAKYDPQYSSNAFSLIGLSGTPAGGGDTQDRRLDGSIKYTGTFYNLVHLGAIYKTQGSPASSYAVAGSGEAFSGFEVSAGAEYFGASVDVFYTKMRDAVSVSALSAAQVADLPVGVSPSNSLSGTISDNASYGAMASYTVPALPLTAYGGYEHITYMNPSIPLTVGFDDLNGYVLGAVNNTAYAKADKILQVYWLGARYAVTPELTAAVAYYGERQNPYATGALLNCDSTESGACTGNFSAVSFSLVYHLTKRFDAYGGAMWSNVSHGLANGYLETNNIDPTLGLRFSF